jgi:hypothetical protein
MPPRKKAGAPRSLDQILTAALTRQPVTPDEVRALAVSYMQIKPRFDHAKEELQLVEAARPLLQAEAAAHNRMQKKRKTGGTKSGKTRREQSDDWKTELDASALALWEKGMSARSVAKHLEKKGELPILDTGNPVSFSAAYKHLLTANKK